MVFHSNITVPDSECYKYIRESNSGKQDFVVCADMNGNKLIKEVSKEEFDDSMCRMVEYK